MRFENTLWGYGDNQTCNKRGRAHFLKSRWEWSSIDDLAYVQVPRSQKFTLVLNQNSNNRHHVHTPLPYTILLFCSVSPMTYDS